MLSTLRGWLQEPNIRIVVLVVVAIGYAAGAVSRWRQGSRRRRAFYIAAGLLLAVWEWHKAPSGVTPCAAHTGQIRFGMVAILFHDDRDAVIRFRVADWGRERRRWRDGRLAPSVNP